MVVVKTADGSAEAALFYPAGKGKWPAVLFWPDYVGLRALYRDMARRFAAQGFVVLVPNTFYRSMRPSETELDPANPAVHATLLKYRADAGDEGIARDALAYFAFLDAQKQTDRDRKVATIGYELGGSYAFRAAAALPDRVAAVGSIYGVSVATARPDSPHLLVPMTRATYYVAIARDHDAREPDDKTDIANAIASANLRGTVEVYPADQGWANPAGKTYDAAAGGARIPGAGEVVPEHARIGGGQRELARPRRFARRMLDRRSGEVVSL
ncbi:MAG: dienelactone hydrolase family protein [Sphingomonas sp.]